MKYRFEEFRAEHLTKTLCSAMSNPDAALAVLTELGRAIEFAMLRGIDIVELKNPKIVGMVAYLHRSLAEEIRSRTEDQKPQGT